MPRGRVAQGEREYRSLAALEDVLLTGAGGLHHLVNRAVAFFEEALAEAIGEILDHLGFLVAEQFAIVAVGGDEAASGHGGVLGWSLYDL